MNYKWLSLALCMSFLFSCGKTNTSGIDTIAYDTTFLNDLSLLKTGPYLSEAEASEKAYNLTYEETSTSSGKGHVYTVIVSYKETSISGLRVILAPGDYLAKGEEHNLPNVGYTETFILGESKDVSRNQAKGCRLSIEMDNAQDHVYASVCYDGITDLYQF